MLQLLQLLKLQLLLLQLQLLLQLLLRLQLLLQLLHCTTTTTTIACVSVGRILMKF